MGYKKGLETTLEALFFRNRILFPLAPVSSTNLSTLPSIRSLGWYG